jgi:hypothetical protein
MNKDQRIADLEAQLAAKSKAPALSLKVSKKGAVSVYGLGRWPVTLYREQWNRLLGKASDIAAFITANDSALSTKPAV